MPSGTLAQMVPKAITTRLIQAGVADTIPRLCIYVCLCDSFSHRLDCVP